MTPLYADNIIGSMELRAQQSRFVDEYLVDLNATAAAARAGYSVRTAKSQGSRLLTNVDVKNEISRRQAETACKLEIRREDIIRGLLGAIELARQQGDPTSMIRGAAELNKMLGFYRPDGEGAGPDETADAGLQKRIESMTDEELIALCASNGDA